MSPGAEVAAVLLKGGNCELIFTGAGGWEHLPSKGHLGGPPVWTTASLLEHYSALVQ